MDRASASEAEGYRFEPYRERFGSGAGVLAAGRDADPALPVVITSPTPTDDTTAEVMRLGAFDFLRQPFRTPDLAALVAHATEHNELSRQKRLLQGEADRLGFSAELLGEVRRCSGSRNASRWWRRRAPRC